MTTELDDPGSYGRVIRDSSGDLERIVEAKTEGDATPEELEIREINSGIYVFDAAPLASALGRITDNNAQGEYYLGDVLPLMRADGLRVTAHLTTDQAVNLGVNSRADLALVEAEARRRILNAHMLAGVTITDPASTWIDAGIEIAPDSTILPGTSLRGATSVGTGSVIGPHSTLIDSTIAERVEVIHSYLTDCEVLDDCSIGPFAYLRPGAHLAEGAKAGTFVEVKNSEHRRRRQGPPPLLRRRRRHRRGRQPRRRHHHRQLRRFPQTPDNHRPRRPNWGRHDADCTCGSRRRRLHWRRFRDRRGRAPGRAGDLAGQAAEHQGIRRPQGRQGRHLLSTISDAPQAAPASAIPHDYSKRAMVFGGRTSLALADNIAKKLGLDLGQVTLKTFSDGEVYCRYEETIRGADVFLVQSTCANPAQGMTPNDALMELLAMADAAQGASAHRIIAVMPWYGYARQDKKSAPREPITARIVAKTLEAVGVDRVLTMDLHAGQVQGFFHIPVDHMTAMPLLTQWFIDQDFGDEELVIVSPDAGRVKVARNFARKVGTHWAVMEKERPAQQVAEIGYVVGDVKGKTAVLTDDMIDTAGTLVAAARTVLDEGAARVISCATHGVFSGPAYERLAYENSGIERIVVTDTIPLRPGAPDNITVLPTAGILADSIRRIFTDDSVSEIFAGENQLF